MTKTEAADFLQTSPQTLICYATAGKLPTRSMMGKTGKQLDFRRAVVERLAQPEATE